MSLHTPAEDGHPDARTDFVISFDLPVEETTVEQVKAAVVAGAFTLCGMYLGHAAMQAYF
ncbi:hypothetical protein HUG10_06085 [Halorarum halophilum]|uniref:Uncharacterized protein n=1 Tax=Halorarum halophilum TaxID=2743090 RepID=A0A7D5K6X7_9EURY|nr:hypothetical protein [Halobaculum halophilum]QLG27139.1 hypothetical protein HUG10_06085 [Halobaculum halophilum]